MCTHDRRSMLAVDWAKLIEDWTNLIAAASLIVALGSLVVSVAVGIRASRWRPRPFLRCRIDVTAGRYEQVDVQEMLDKGQVSIHGVMLLNIEDVAQVSASESDKLHRGLLVTVVNHGNAPAFDVEVRLAAPSDRSAATLMFGDFAVLRRPQMAAGDEISFVVADDLQFGTVVKGAGRWEGMEVWGARVEAPHGTELEAQLTWREPPKLNRQMQRAISHPAKAEVGSSWF